MRSCTCPGLRFVTDSNVGGAEKLSVCLLPPTMYVNRPVMKAADISNDGGLCDAFTLLFVKGWTRSLGCVAVMLAAFENDDLLKADGVDTDGVTYSKLVLYVAKQALPHAVKEYGPQFLPSTQASLSMFTRHQVVCSDSWGSQNVGPQCSHGHWSSCGSKPRPAMSLVRFDGCEPLNQPFVQV